MSLEKEPSQSIVAALLQSLSPEKVMDILQVNATRLKALVDCRGCLKDEQLNFITKKTGKSWMRWGVDAGAERLSRSADGRAILAATYELMDRRDPQPERKVVTKSRRGKSSRAPLKKAS